MWNDFRAAALLMTTYKDCGEEGCECCMRVMQVFGKQYFQEYLESDEFKAGKVSPPPKVWEMRIIVGRNSCQARHQHQRQLTTDNAHYRCHAGGKRWR